MLCQLNAVLASSPRHQLSNSLHADEEAKDFWNTSSLLLIKLPGRAFTLQSRSQRS